MKPRKLLEEAFKLIEENEDQSDFEGKTSEDLVNACEKKLGVKLPYSYREFLKNYGAGDIAGEEFYGICNNSLDGEGVPNVTWYNVNERSRSKLPQHLVVIYSYGDGGPRSS